jgi:hypothetical protein
MTMEQPLTDLASKRGGGGSLLLRGLLVLSLVIVATLFAAELLLRVIDVSGPIRSELGEAFQFDPELGWVPAPNAATQQTSGNRTISVRHNGLGLRERELGDIAPDRFLFLGDSFTYGYDAEANERFSDLLQKALPQYGMVNAGVSGYGTDQQFLLMKRLWNDVNPKYVVLTFCVDNDRDDNTSSYRYRKYHKPYFVRTGEGEWQVRGDPLPRPTRDAATGSAWLERFALARFVIDAYRALRNREIIVPDPTEDLIGMMRRTVEARGARLVVGLQRHEPRLETYLRAQKIPYTTFDEAPGYPVAGWHWTPEGNAVVAKKYLALFAEIGVPSDPRQASSAPPLPAHNAADGQQHTVATPSVLSPFIWLAAAQALPGELIELGRYLQNWSTAVQDSHGWLRVGVALLVLTVLAMTTAMLWFGWQRRMSDAAGTPGRFSKALSSFGVFLCLAFATPLLTITLLEATEVRMIEISYGFIAGVVIAAFGRAAALGVFAPDAPQRRLLALDDLTARSFANHLIWGTRALGALLFVLAIHKALAAPAAMTVATNMLFALVAGILLLHLLLSHRHNGENKLPLARWLRGWLVVGVIAIALVAGYPTFAAFVAARVISISALLAGLYLLLALGNALFAGHLAVDTPYGQALAADFGVSAPWLGFAAILTCAGVCVAAMLAALVLYIGPW